MLIKSTLVTLLGLAVVAEASNIHRVPVGAGLARRQNRFGGNKGGNQGGNQGGNAGNNGGNQGGNAGNNGGNQGGNAGNNGGQQGATETCLSANALQTGSAQDGQDGGDVAAGQVASKTDNANFINICAGQTLTNGLQVQGGSCNGIPMGKIPATNKMVSTVITNPKNLDTITEKQTFNVAVSIANMALGSFTNAQETYYSAPQDLDGGGNIIGHTHVTIQDVGNSLNPTKPLDATQFAFFKGINDAGDGNGDLTAEVTGGLPAGNYRVCTMSGASNHQPVLMPVAQRGAQDDCRYFTVAAAGAGGNNNNNGGNNAGNAGNNAGNAGNNAGNAGNNAGNAGNNAGNAGNNGGNNGGNAANNAGNNVNNGATAGNQGGNRGNQGQGGNQGGNQGNQGQGGNQGAGQGNQGQGGNQGAGQGGNRGNQGNSNGTTPEVTNGSASDSQGGAAADSGAGSAAGGSGDAGATSGNAGALGGLAAPAVTDTGDSKRPFGVNGNTFATKAAATQRACAIQNNQCADAVNAGKMQGTSVADCNAQEQACNAAA